MGRFGLKPGIDFAHFGLESGIHFAHFGLESGMVFEGTTECMNVFNKANQAWLRSVLKQN